MLSDADRQFIAHEMKICLTSIDSRLSESDLEPDRDRIVKAIRFFIRSIKKYGIGTREGNDFTEDCLAENAINQHFCKVQEKLEGDEAKAILDSLRHAFCSFAFNGLHQLYTRQENGVWYPKVIVDCEIKPNDTDCLPSLITLYRGTDHAEYNSRTFRQSWTTCRDVAYEFAFRHYEHQPWFNEESRVLLKTEYPREGVYYSCQSGEYEVVIDPSKIGEVEVFT